MRRDWGETICGTHAQPNVELFKIPCIEKFIFPTRFPGPLSSYPRGIMEGWRDAKPWQRGCFTPYFLVAPQADRIDPDIKLIMFNLVCHVRFDV